MPGILSKISQQIIWGLSLQLVISVVMTFTVMAHHQETLVNFIISTYIVLCSYVYRLYQCTGVLDAFYLSYPIYTNYTLHGSIMKHTRV